MIRTISIVSMLFAIIATTTGCRSVGFLRGGSGEFVSDEQPTKLTPHFVTRLYDSKDHNTADIVLSDLDKDVLADRAAWSSAVGQVLHARMFIQPRAGRTPIETTACSVTMRYIVLTGGDFGIYAGGGFLLPDGAPEGSRFSGVISNASLRLVSSSPDFKDLIGSGRMSLSFRVRRDDRTVRSVVRNADFLAFGALPSPDNPLLISRE